MFIDHVTKEERAVIVAQFMYKVYAWMSVGLLVTASVAYGLFQQLWLLEILFSSQWMFFSLIIAQIALVSYLGTRIEHLRYQTAAMFFLLYSALVGVTLSAIFIVYTMTSIMQVFVISAGMFGSMALYGYITKDDLTKMGYMLMMCLFGLVIAQLTNMFLHSSLMNYYLSLFGVVLFSILTAYDVQKLKILRSKISVYDVNTMAIKGAITLYLDFLNLFLNLLRIMGKKRE